MAIIDEKIYSGTIRRGRESNDPSARGYLSSKVISIEDLKAKFKEIHLDSGSQY